MKYKRKNGNSINFQQMEGVEEPFKKLFCNTKPATVIEIGTAGGGFTICLREALDEVGHRPARLITVDPKPRRQFKEWERVEGLKKSCFTNEKQTTLTKVLRDAIEAPGRAIVLCDGGNKFAEFEAAAKLLKEGDIVAAHDYCVSLEDFRDRVKGKLWPCCGINGRRMTPVCEKYGLRDFMEEDFAPFVWGMRRRF